MKITRPVLRYHGGKWLLAPWIISHFPDHGVYVEPFGGAGSVLLRKPRSFSEVYNDLDQEVVNLFAVLRSEQATESLCLRLELTPFSRIEFDAAKASCEDSVERAARLVIRSFMGFGSAAFNKDYVTGFRAASKQTGRPHAKDWANLPECLWIVTERLRGVVIECRDGLEVIRQQDSSDTLFYLDPPYLHSTRPTSNHKQYSFEWGDDNHRMLASVLASIKGKAILSGFASPLYDSLYSGWRRTTRIARASGQKGYISRQEVLWMNF